MGKPIMTGAKHDAAVVLYEAGWPDIKIAETFGTSHNTVAKWRRANGLHTKSVYAQKIDDARARQMYESGMSDGQMAKAFNATQSGVTRWRQRHGLEPNFEKAPGLSLTEVRRAKALLRKGASRRQIADELGRKDVSAIQKLRRTMKHEPGLRRAGMTTLSDRRNASKDAASLHRRVIRAVDNGVAHDIAEEAVSEMLLDLMQGKLRPEQIETQAHKYKSRMIGEFASSYGPRSLDEVDEDGMGLADLIADPYALPAMEAAVEQAFGGWE